MSVQRLFFLTLFLLTLCGCGILAASRSVAAADPEMEHAIEGWGQFIDPAGDCRATRDDNGIVTISVPGTQHNLNPLPEYDNVLAPRVLQAVEGDFQLQVVVRPFPRPKAKTSTTKQGHSYVAAGLVIWQDDKTFMRWFRAANGERGDLFVHSEAFVEAKPQAFRFLAKNRQIPDEATHLRVERRYGRVKLSWSRDGQAWTAFAQMPDDGLSARLKVGVAVVNSTKAEFDPQFERLQLTTKNPKP